MFVCLYVRSKLRNLLTGLPQILIGEPGRTFFTRLSEILSGLKCIGTALLFIHRRG